VTSLLDTPQPVRLRWADLPSNVQVQPPVHKFDLLPDSPVQVSFTLTGRDDALEAGEQWAAVVVEYPGGSQRWELPVTWRPAAEQIELEMTQPPQDRHSVPKLIRAGVHHRSGRQRWIVTEDPPTSQDFYVRVERSGEYAVAAMMVDDGIQQQSFFIQVDDQPSAGLPLAEDAADWEDYPLYSQGLMAGPRVTLAAGYHKLTIPRYPHAASKIRHLLLAPLRDDMAVFLCPSYLVVGAGGQARVTVAVANFTSQPLPVTLGSCVAPASLWMRVDKGEVTIPPRSLKELSLSVFVPAECDTATHTAHVDIRTPHKVFSRSLQVHTIQVRDTIEMEGEDAETVRYGSHPVICEATDSGYALSAEWPSGRRLVESAGTYYPGHRWFFEVGKPAGYTVWARVLWQKSWWDREPQFHPYRYTAWLGFDDKHELELDGTGLVGQWTWMRGPTEDLAVGSHFVQWSNGWVNVLIDKIVVTADPHFQPEGAAR